MEIDYSKRKHESPFADDPAEATLPENAPPFVPKPSKHESPFVNETPPNLSLRNPNERTNIFQPPFDRIEVINRRGSNTAIIFIVAFPTALIALFILSSNIRNAAYAAILFVCAVFFTVGFLIFNARRNSVRLLDSSGVTRGDGRHFPWSDFKGTITRWSSNRFAGKSIWRIELYFNGGQVWILPSNIKNGKEVLDYVKSLPPLS